MARVTASQRDVYPSAVLFFILPYLFCDGRITPPLIGCLPPYLLTPHPCPILQTPATEPMLSLLPLPLSPSLSLPSSFSLSLSLCLSPRPRLYSPPHNPIMERPELDQDYEVRS